MWKALTPFTSSIQFALKQYVTDVIYISCETVVSMIVQVELSW